MFSLKEGSYVSLFQLHRYIFFHYSTYSIQTSLNFSFFAKQHIFKQNLQSISHVCYFRTSQLFRDIIIIIVIHSIVNGFFTNDVYYLIIRYLIIRYRRLSVWCTNRNFVHLLLEFLVRVGSSTSSKAAFCCSFQLLRNS